jgi:serine/threonine protein phosphatase PrpC
MYIANTGDSQTVVFSVDSNTTKESGPTIAYRTQKDHAILPDEYARIIGLGGNVHINPNTNYSSVVVYSVEARENIMLGMSRSLGDWEWKAVGVTAEPLVGVVDLNDHPKSFLMMASDGVWDLRRREFYGKRFLDSFYRGTTHPLLKVLNVFELVTPKNPNWYRDDMTAIVMKL